MIRLTCTSKYKCFHCQQKHNTSLCNRAESKNPPETSNLSSVTDSEDTTNVVLLKAGPTNYRKTPQDTARHPQGAHKTPQGTSSAKLL